MTLIIKHQDTEFGIGDRIKVTQKIKEAGKERNQAFEGILISIRGEGMGQTFTVRRIGVHLIGIERIFPTFSPTIEKIEVLKKGVKGVRSAKLYYIRRKSKKEIETIYTRAFRKDKVQEPKFVAKKTARKKAPKRTANVKSAKK